MTMGQLFLVMTGKHIVVFCSRMGEVSHFEVFFLRFHRQTDVHFMLPDRNRPHPRAFDQLPHFRVLIAWCRSNWFIVFRCFAMLLFFFMQLSMRIEFANLRTIPGQVSALQGQISALQGQVSALQGQVSAIQSELKEIRKAIADQDDRLSGRKAIAKAHATAVWILIDPNSTKMAQGSGTYVGIEGMCVVSTCKHVVRNITNGAARKILRLQKSGRRELKILPGDPWASPSHDLGLVPVACEPGLTPAVISPFLAHSKISYGGLILCRAERCWFMVGSSRLVMDSCKPIVEVHTVSRSWDICPEMDC
jgi:hypothetical protein